VPSWEKVWVIRSCLSNAVAAWLPQKARKGTYGGLVNREKEKKGTDSSCLRFVWSYLVILRKIKEMVQGLAATAYASQHFLRSHDDIFTGAARLLSCYW
jgi:hypothetical protein